MKKYAIAVTVLLVIAIIVLVTQMGGKSALAPSGQESVDKSSDAVTTGTSGGTKSTVKPTTGGTVTVPKVPVSTGGTYIDEIKTRAALTEACNKASANQYNQIYAGKYAGVSQVGYINKSMTGCYMKVSGSTVATYTTKPASILIFRNVYKNQLIADCVNTAPETSNWQCTDRLTGQSIPRLQYDDMIGKYLLQ